MNDSLKDTIAPKSDQLNADDLLTGPITVQILSVKRGNSEQPVSIGISGGYQPFKPCKSMRRVMIAIWGDKGSDWVGQSMTLYCDPEVKFGGVKVGGIRISHMTGIDKPHVLMLTTTRARRSEYTVQPLVIKPQETIQQILQDAAMEGSESLKNAFSNLPASQEKTEYWSSNSERLKKAAAEADNK